MNFNTFITLFENKKKNGGIDDFIEYHMKNHYVSFEEKQARANVIIENTFYEKDENGNRYFHVNSVATHMFVFLTLVDMYTDIEIDYKKSLEQYNKLKETDGFDFIIPNISKSEMTEFKIILDSMKSDIITNEYEPHAYFSQQVDRFGKIISAVIEPFLDKISPDDIANIIGKLNNKVS